jgi:hypothetical protein
MFCSNCGFKLQDDWNCCPQCGNAIARVGTATGPAPAKVSVELNTSHNLPHLIASTSATQSLDTPEKKALAPSVLLSPVTGMGRWLAWFWYYPAAAVSRLSRMAQAVMIDGFYLAAWPKVAAFLPPASLLFGLLVGCFHFAPGDTFTFSLFIMALLFSIANFGAALGVWLLVGYCLGDFFYFHHLESYLLGNYSLKAIVIAALALGIVYVLLAMLIVLLPVISLGLRRTTLRKIKAGSGAHLFLAVPLQMLVQAGLVFIWIQNVPTLIRPFYVWQNYYPPVEAMQPLQINGNYLVGWAALLGAIRVVLEHFARRSSVLAVQAKELRNVLEGKAHRPVQLPDWLVSVFKAALATLMLSGLILEWWEAFVLFSATALIFFARDMGQPKWEPWKRFVAHVPLVLRIAVAGFLSYQICLLIVNAMWSGTDTFRPLIVSVVVSLLVFVLIIPKDSPAPLTPKSAGESA